MVARVPAFRPGDDAIFMDRDQEYQVRIMTILGRGMDGEWVYRVCRCDDSTVVEAWEERFLYRTVKPVKAAPPPEKQEPTPEAYGSW